MTLQTATRTDQLVVVNRIERSTSVTEFVLERADGSRLPDWAPGAHIDVVLPSGKIRQYSLCGDRWTPHQYRIAVQREEQGSGASIEIHADVQLGDVLSFGGPRNNFRLAPAANYRFIAGGIGITAMLPMIAQAEKLQVPWQLLYLGKSADRMAYRNLEQQYPQQVTLHASYDQGRASISQWLGELPEDTMVYACGPEEMLTALPEECAQLPNHFLRTERFTNTLATATVNSAPYEIELYRSGKMIQAPGTAPVLDVLAKAGVNVITSCSKGVWHMRSRCGRR